MRRLWLLIALVGCGRIHFDNPCLIDEPIAPGTTDVVLCAGKTKLLVAADPGSRLAVSLEAAPITAVSIDLKTPDGEFIAGPVWNTRVESTGLVTVGGEQRILIDSALAMPARVTVTITPPAGRVFYMSPNGSDADAGTDTKPWQTWPFALDQLQAGDTLIVGKGTWAAGDCTGEPTPCLPNAAMPVAAGDNGIASGTPERPITIVSRYQRRALLAGNGEQHVFTIRNCAHWIVDGFHAKSRDAGIAANNPPGSLFLFLETPGLRARNLLAEKPNGCGNNHAIDLGGVTSVGAVIEDSEVYNFHRGAVQLFDTPSSVAVRRVYAHSRDFTTVCPGVADGYRERGDVGMTCFVFTTAETHCTFENIAVENVGSAYDDYRSRAIRVHASLARDAYFGMYAGGGGPPPVVRTMPVQLRDFACANCDIGVWNRGVQIEVTNATFVGGQPRLSMEYGIGAHTDDAGGTTAQATYRNVLVLDNKRFGFYNVNTQQFLVRYSAAFGSPILYQPAETIEDDTGNVQRSIATQPTRIGDRDDACLAYVPADSNLATAGENGAPIGAMVIDRIENGVPVGKLWHQRTGQFPCGAIVTGVNDVDGASCFDAHKRFRIGRAGCAIP